jgi:hypothetical protein
MTLPLTPHMLAAAYDFLRECPPFKRWRLPESDAIEFKVASARGHYGWQVTRPGGNLIAISANAVGHTDSLLFVLAHEMLHLRQSLKKTCTHSEHNAEFRRVAHRICHIHGWDEKGF